MLWLDRIFSPKGRRASDVAYQQAMGDSDDLIRRMRECSNSNDPARAVMADIWAQHHNVPFMVSIYETVAEMKHAVGGNGRRPPPLPK